MAEQPAVLSRRSTPPAAEPGIAAGGVKASDAGRPAPVVSPSPRSAEHMEAVGRLAGSVAHDFNNILAAISGYANLLAGDLPAGDPRQAYVAEIQKATERAIRLARQLLAIGRRDAREPRRLDLSSVVADVLPMLRQLAGQRVELVVVPGENLPAVVADPGQIEQILVNLVLNARDAMPAGGRIAIRTEPARVDRSFVATHAGSRPGRFVRLAVEDCGTGMEADVIAHMFEPHFTTKPPDRGTGLGLATVYGIVKQSGGFVWAESEPGRGTTMMVDLPEA
jgi:two-component system cell cycle sensor histidine kinase/response regulator CckA